MDSKSRAVINLEFPGMNSRDEGERDGSSQAGYKLFDGSEDVEKASRGNLPNGTLDQDDETTVEMQKALIMSLRSASDF